MEKKFGQILLRWHKKNKRDLPWVGVGDPYLVWLSEIIMQQTRVEQGTAYYLKFARLYPSVAHLAEASEDAVLKLWEGLGYYSRARNMHHTAKEIMLHWEGQFPADFENILKLKGIGKYTASAIASYAFGQPYAVVDGNVFRILARIFGIKLPINGSAGKKKFELLAYSLLDKKHPAAFNQAMMDFGSAICKPVNPLCVACPFNKVCFAYLHNETDKLPVKSQKPGKRIRYFQYLVFVTPTKTVISRRNGKDIWKNLYQFPHIETARTFSKKELIGSREFMALTDGVEVTGITESAVLQQQLTHQTIRAKFFIVSVKKINRVKALEGEIVPLQSLKDFAFPGIIRSFLPELSTFID